MDQNLSDADRKLLLEIARQAIQTVADRQRLLRLAVDEYSSGLQQDGASFVTLTISEQLRGCIGTLEAYQPLVLDVQEHAAAAASEDYRFPPVRPEEVPLLQIEISRLTPTQPLPYENWMDLINKLRPGLDGVLIRDGVRRATFLPQVWEKVPDPQEFMSHLCIKMGAPSDHWRMHKMDVYTYQVEEFKEEK
jgi:AmmeMemoRadiSam system protein A